MGTQLKNNHTHMYTIKKMQNNEWTEVAQCASLTAAEHAMRALTTSPKPAKAMIEKDGRAIKLCDPAIVSGAPVRKKYDVPTTIPQSLREFTARPQ